jgi:hypothetical protein
MEHDIILKNKGIELVKTIYYNLPNNGLSDYGINSCSSRLKEAKKASLISIDFFLDTLNETEHKDLIDYYKEIKNTIENYEI